jgi:hypothetical protein
VESDEEEEEEEGSREVLHFFDTRSLSTPLFHHILLSILPGTVDLALRHRDARTGG